MKLKQIQIIQATLRCASGLHIGGGDAEMHIGGFDKTVVRNPLTQLPYIPGSSLKGKMRSLLEWRSGAVRSEPLGWSDFVKSGENESVLTILKLFGVGGSDQLTNAQAERIGPSRLSFWDCEMADDWTKMLHEGDLLPTEAKNENSIDRISGKALNPRCTERVIAGTAFDFRLSLKVLDCDGDDMLKTVLAGLRLLEFDSLGGSGSRGYGKVKFENVTIDGKDCQAEFEQIDPFKI